MYTCSPKSAKTASMNTVKMMTSLRFLTEYMMALTMVFKPGITATDLSARNTLNVLRAENDPRSIAMVTYDIAITVKSNQFQASRRYENGSRKSPRESNFIADSYV